MEREYSYQLKLKWHRTRYATSKGQGGAEALLSPSSGRSPPPRGALSSVASVLPLESVSHVGSQFPTGMDFVESISHKSIIAEVVACFDKLALPSMSGVQMGSLKSQTISPGSTSPSRGGKRRRDARPREGSPMQQSSNVYLVMRDVLTHPPTFMKQANTVPLLHPLWLVTRMRLWFVRTRMTDQTIRDPGVGMRLIVRTSTCRLECEVNLLVVWFVVLAVR